MMSGKKIFFNTAFILLFSLFIINCNFNTGISKEQKNEVDSFDSQIKECEMLYQTGDFDKCVKKIKNISNNVKKNSLTNYIRTLTYLMRLSYEAGEVENGEKYRKMIDDEIKNIKDKDYLKNLFMARSSIYANAGKFEEADNDIKKSIGYKEDIENLMTSATIFAKYDKKYDSYKMLQKIFKVNFEGVETVENIIMKNIMASIICLSFKDYDYARPYIDIIMEKLPQVSDFGFLGYILKSLLDNIFSVFEYNPLNIGYYEKIYSVAYDKKEFKTAGEMSLKIARILANIGCDSAAENNLFNAINLLNLGIVKAEENVPYDVLEQLYSASLTFIKLKNYEMASKMLEKSVIIYSKKGNLKDSFEKIRKLAYCNFKKSNESWVGLMDELLKTCADLKDTRELYLTKNAIGEIYLETNETKTAYKYIDDVFEAIDRSKPDVLPSSGYIDIYFKSIYNLILIAEKEGNYSKALKIAEKYCDMYEKNKKTGNNNKKSKKTESFSKFTVQVGFSISEIDDFIGLLQLKRAELLSVNSPGEKDAIYETLKTAISYLENSDESAEFNKALDMFLTLDKNKDRDDYKKIKAISIKHKEIIKKYSNK